MQYRIRIEFEGFRSPGLTLTSSDEEHLVGISPTYLFKIERGDFSAAKRGKIKAIAKELGQDADELLALAGRVAPDLDEIIPAKATRDGNVSTGRSRIDSKRY